MDVKKTTTEEIELKPEEVEKIIKDYFQSKGFEITNILFNINRVYNDYDDHYGNDILTSIMITRKITTKHKL